MRLVTVLTILLFALGPITVGMARAQDHRVPQLDYQGQQAFAAFLEAPVHAAFVIAPGGVWTWQSGHPTAELAEAEVLKACREMTQQSCHVYAVDGQVVFDAWAWRESWSGPLSVDQVSNAPTGTLLNQRFPNLALVDPNGAPAALENFRGRTVVLHFWGSWCPPCAVEFPDLQKLYDALSGDENISFVLVQAREAIGKSRRWTERNGVTMPLYDSGHTGFGDTAFQLADGTTRPYRELAPVFPTTYVLDGDGLVVFRKPGPGFHWEQYQEQIRNVRTANRDR